MPLAFYRKYRPQNFSDLIGHETNIEILKNTAVQDKLAHAYLFFGPRGTGKTSAARILAKIANCETRAKDENFRKKGEPCNKCRPCQEIENGSALDVIEIDAASNRGIDEIRNIQEGIRLSPTSYRYKVFIIDEVHMLTIQAFNALLKTLEEPPAHAIFILATTEFEKVPLTITSRTQRFSFKKISKDKIIQKLDKILEKEKINIEKDAIELIAAASEGSFRDAESLLDQIATFSEKDKKITLEKVEKIIGKAGIEKIDELTSYLLEDNAEKSLEFLSKLQESGYNIVQFTKDLIHYLRRILTIKTNPKIEKILKIELTDFEIEKIKNQAPKIEIPRLITLLKSFIAAYSQMRYSPFVIIPLEVAIIEFINTKK